jgi:hypothetical protein
VNLYLLAEGRRTEKKLYSSWLLHLFPELRIVERPEDVTENCLRLVTGGGYPQYLELVEIVLEEIAMVVKNRVDHFFICVDAEEVSLVDRLIEVEEWVTSCLPQIRYSVIVQNCCIETWLLANRRLLKRNPQSESLRNFKKFYDVGILDPENMPAKRPHRIRAKSHEAYLKEMFRERGLSYSKKAPGEAAAAGYLAELVSRYDETEHIPTFGKFLTLCRSLELRSPGRLKGKIQMAADFDAPLPEEIAAPFRGERE